MARERNAFSLYGLGRLVKVLAGEGRNRLKNAKEGVELLGRKISSARSPTVL